MLQQYCEKCKAYRPLARAIRAAVRDPLSYTLLDSGEGGTWSAGGCAILADALLALIPDAKRIGIKTSSPSCIHHVAVQLPCGAIIDADGLAHPAFFLRRYQLRERLPFLTIVPLRPDAEIPDIPQNAHVSNAMRALILRRLKKQEKEKS